jgi:hypothetical protein
LRAHHDHLYLSLLPTMTLKAHDMNISFPAHVFQP